MNLDIPTITLLIVISSTVAMAQLMAARRFGGHVGNAMIVWSGGFAMGGLGHVLMLYRGDFVSRLLANSLIIVGIAGFYVAIKLLKQERYSLGYVLAPIAVFMLLFTYFVQIDNNMPVRVVAFNLCISAILLPLCHSLFTRVPADRRSTYWMTGLLFSWILAVLLIRAVAVLDEHFFHTATIGGTVAPSMWFTSAFLVTVAAGLFFMLMASEEFAAQISHLATHDALTDIYNRRAFENLAQQRLTADGRTGSISTLLTLDLDSFKSINDKYGHAAGDKVLVQATRTIVSNLRACDIFGRYGGDEFCILLPDTGAHEALLVGERLRQAVEAMVITVDDVNLTITVSIGMAVDEARKSDLEALLVAADKRLYQAKLQGRNYVRSA